MALAEIADAQAVADHANELRKIAEAVSLVDDGDALLTVADYVGAIGRYQEAVRAVYPHGRGNAQVSLLVRLFRSPRERHLSTDAV